MDLIRVKYGEENLDALPYIDIHYEGMQDQVHSLIEQEMKTFRPPNYLENYPAVELAFSEHPLLQEEMKRIQTRVDKKSNTPLAAIDLSRYSLQPPALNLQNDYQAWKQAVNAALSQLQHQYLRLENLKLLQSYGPNAWKQYNTELQGTQKLLSHQLELLRTEIEELNALRKKEQSECGMQLQNLETQWTALIHKNLEIEAACNKLEQEVNTMKRQKDVD